MIAHSSVYRFVVPLSLVSLIMKTVQHQSNKRRMIQPCNWHASDS